MSDHWNRGASHGSAAVITAGAVAAGAVTLSKYSVAPTPSAQSTQTSLGPSELTPAQASRFLAQASNGATRADIDALVNSGIASWLDTQFAMPRSQSHWDWLVAAGYGADKKLQSQGWDNSIWRQLISAPDQLRQRVALALLDILVVSIDGLTLGWRNFAMAAYMDVLLDHAFGNYRDLLGAITANAAMSNFLTFLNNRCEQLGAHPDENYARELMQLFTIGLYELNEDGTEQIGADGLPIETYSQADVSQLARVFTGLVLSSKDYTIPDRLREPLVMRGLWNETASSTILGQTVPPGGKWKAINRALDVLFAHRNVPPFVSRSLIQRLVASNPSPGYVQRVAAVFADNGQGVRGDLMTVVRTILTDSEARDPPPFGSANTERLRDPVQRFTNWARAFKVTSLSGRWAFGDLSDPAGKLAESPGRSPSVFNFFRPRYTPPNTEISRAGLVAPEFQITTEESVIGYVNFMAITVPGRGDIAPDYGDVLALASDSDALVDEINLILAAGGLSATTAATIKNAIDSVSLSARNAAQRRVNIAVTLALASPEYLAVS
jgi:uncharacterized protein (DUF1800 family)